MARLPYVAADQLPPDIADRLASRPPLNLYRMLPHAPAAASGFLALGGALLTQSALHPHLRELAILRVGVLSGASYEVHQHRRVAATVGLPQAKIDAVADGPASPVFDALERRVLTFTDRVVTDVKAPTDQFDGLAAELGARQITELVLTIGFYMMVSRFLENFEVDIEPPGSIDFSQHRRHEAVAPRSDPPVPPPNGARA